MLTTALTASGFTVGAWVVAMLLVVVWPVKPAGPRPTALLPPTLQR